LLLVSFYHVSKEWLCVQETLYRYISCCGRKIALCCLRSLRSLQFLLSSFSSFWFPGRRIKDILVCTLRFCCFTPVIFSLSFVETVLLPPHYALLPIAHRHCTFFNTLPLPSSQAWKISAGVCDRSIMSPSKSFRIAVVPDSGLLVTGHFDGALRFWDPRKREALAHEVAGVHSKEVYSAAVAPGGRTYQSPVYLFIYLSSVCCVALR
jgi:WD40 repeat protein